MFIIKRLAAAALAVVCIGIVVTAVVECIDLYAFELPPILEVMGWVGVATTVVLLAGAAAVGLGAAQVALNPLGQWRALFGAPGRRTRAVALGAWCLFLLWVVQWTFMEKPWTQRLAHLIGRQAGVALSAEAEADFRGFSVVQSAADPGARRALRIMFERIILNTPDIYARHPIGSTIDGYARRYGVDARLLFFLNYIDSYYGEAPPGPVPFLHELTPESMRDLVQLHLPSWFVENPIRRYMIVSGFLPAVAGESFGWKLKYAFQKATLDVSLSPYALNTYSDIFLVLREYPQEFPELVARPGDNGVVVAMRESFLALRETAMIPPYEDGHSRPPYPDSYYAAHRRDLKRFARASAYLAWRDFDFATRVQALLSRYEQDYFRRELGTEKWDVLPAWQQAAMLSMIRDLLKRDVGHPGYDIYTVQELNCTPAWFVVNAARTEPNSLGASMEKVWRPKHYDELWAGAGYRLHVLSELWQYSSGKPLPGIVPETTVDDAAYVLGYPSR